MAAYANMDQEAAWSYKRVKKAILRRFDINDTSTKISFYQEGRFTELHGVGCTAERFVQETMWSW